MNTKYPNGLLLWILRVYQRINLYLTRSTRTKKNRLLIVIIALICGVITLTNIIDDKKPRVTKGINHLYQSEKNKQDEALLKKIVKKEKLDGAKDPIQELLIDTFKKVDKNKNKLLSSVEIERWIKLKMEEHLAQALSENEDVFKLVDRNNDGKVTWDEYHINYLIAKGVDETIAEKHLEVHDDLDLRDQEVIVQDKFRFAEADEDSDGVLVVDEFLCFKHPEHSSKMLYQMVRDILNNLDKDGDDKLTPSEFAAMPPGEDEDVWMESESKFQAERFKEFNMVIDLNKDGFVTFEELLKYTDPKNVQHAKIEAESLVTLSDTNKDGMVSLEELLKQRELFLGSKVVNVGDVVHEEF